MKLLLFLGLIGLGAYSFILHKQVNDLTAEKAVMERQLVEMKDQLAKRQSAPMVESSTALSRPNDPPPPPPANTGKNGSWMWDGHGALDQKPGGR